jgi:hypothetical protein
LKIAAPKIVEIAETNLDIQWGQFHSKNLFTWPGNRYPIETPIENILKINDKTTGTSVLSHNS